VRYSRRGAFAGQLAIAAHFVPDPSRLRGVRENAAFESLTLSPDGQRLFSGTETALLQDGGNVSFDSGTTARLLEYVARGETFVPAREFAYPLDPIGAPPFTVRHTDSGLVELLALSRTELLALERTFIELAAGPGHGINRIRLHHVSLADADDVSARESLRDGAFRPVRKTLLQDFSELGGLPPELNTLDNFEGLAAGPRLADGSSSLLVVSDDNFNRTQRTWFLLLRLSRKVN
jgi:hypothetical protein